MLSALVGSQPDTLFYTATGEKIDVEDFPKEKAQFDAVFNTIITEECNQRLVVGFEIRSTSLFHPLKKSVWPLLTQQGIFMKKHPGPLLVMDLVTLGFLHKAHPTFASPTCLREEIMTNLQENLAKRTTDELTAFNIPDDGKIADIFVTPGQANGTYQNAPIHSNVVYLQAERTNVDLLRTCLEQCFHTDSFVFIPNYLKRENSELYGNFLCRQNDFLENNRNIAIVALSTKAMDFDDQPSQESLDDDPNAASNAIWNVVRTIPGISRIDSCRRTFDLGKWNLTTTQEHYPSVCAWIDEHLATLFNSLPDDIQATSQFAEFPVPRRLTKTNRSNSNRMPQGSVSAYNQALASRFTASSKVTTVQRSAWRPQRPVNDISYAFDDSEFPPMAKKQDTDTKSTASLSNFGSSLNEQSLKDAIAAEPEKLRDESSQREAAMDTRIQSIEASLSKLTSAIVGQIFTQLSGTDSPFVTKTQLDEKLDRQFAMIEKLSKQLEKITSAVATPATGIINSPPCKQARSHSPELPIGSPDHTMVESTTRLE